MIRKSGNGIAEPIRDGESLGVQGLRKTFGRRTLWSGLSFSASVGSMTVVQGPSGSGKTTLLNCLGGLEPFDSGVVSYFGYRLDGSSRIPRLAFRDVLGYLFQNYGLIESWSVRRNLLVPYGQRGRVQKSRDQAIADALERVGLVDKEHEPVYTLSGGEQQRVALARMMLKRPKLVLADEPTSALDNANADIVLGLLRVIAEDGAIVLISSHDQQVADLCDRGVDLVPYMPR